MNAVENEAKSRKPGGMGTPKLEWEHVFDKHNPPRRVRGLWRRRASGQLYAYMNASSNGLQYFYPLHADTVAQAVTARQGLKELQRKGELLPPGQMDIPGDAPSSVDKGSSGMTLEEAVDGYQTERDALDLKDEATCDREDSGLAFWVKKFGKMRFADVDGSTLTAFATWRKTLVNNTNAGLKKRAKKGLKTRKPAHLSGRTLDLNILALNHVRNWAKKQKHLPKDTPDLEWQKLAEKPATDELIEPADMDEICNAALIDPALLEMIDKKYRHLRAAQSASGQNFHDYLRLLQRAGGRENETIKQRWSYVTWSRIAKEDERVGNRVYKQGEKIRGKLFFPGVNAKAGRGKAAEDRWVILSDKLEEHLRAMYDRRDPDSDWMFPARKGKGHVLRFSRQMERVKRQLREKYITGHPTEADKSFWFDRITFQWFRHYFISHCVMAHVDFMTIAKWVSQRDGGVLIGKIYGHLDATHEDLMADQLSDHLRARGA